VSRDGFLWDVTGYVHICQGIANGPDDLCGPQVLLNETPLVI
jgi:hypothetical protein